jgi:hypothetical protein
MGQKVSLNINITNEDNSAFMDGALNYHGVSPAGVVLIEGKFLGVVNDLHSVAQANVAPAAA